MEEKLPLYEAISLKILQGIQSGQFQEVLPTEHELAAFYSVSRSTVRSALQKLNNDNIVKTLHGKGSYITKQSHDIPLRIDKLKGFYQLLSETGQKVTLKELGSCVTNSFQSEFPLPASFYTGPILIIKRLLSSNGKPQIYLEEHLACADLKKALPNKLPYSLYELLYKITGQHIKYTVTRFRPILPSEEVMEIFGIDPNTPILLTTEQHYNMMNLYMLFSKIYINNNSDMQIGLIRTK